MLGEMWESVLGCGGTGRGEGRYGENMGEGMGESVGCTWKEVRVDVERGVGKCRGRCEEVYWGVGEGEGRCGERYGKVLWESGVWESVLRVWGEICRFQEEYNVGKFSIFFIA